MDVEMHACGPTTRPLLSRPTACCRGNAKGGIRDKGRISSYRHSFGNFPAIPRAERDAMENMSRQRHTSNCSWHTPHCHHATHRASSPAPIIIMPMYEPEAVAPEVARSSRASSMTGEVPASRCHHRTMEETRDSVPACNTRCSDVMP